MERTPSLTIERNPLLIRKSFEEMFYYRNSSFPYYRKKCLTNENE